MDNATKIVKLAAWTLWGVVVPVLVALNLYGHLVYNFPYAFTH